MNDITNRFINVYNLLLDTKKVNSASAFAKKIGVSSSLMTEILKGRSNVGLSLIQNTVLEYGVNLNYIILGIGSLFDENMYISKEPSLSNENIDCNECKLKNQIIESKNQTIEALQAANDAQKRQIELLENIVNENNRRVQTGGQKRKTS